MDINNLWSGYDLNSKKQNTRCLAVNTILEGKYLVGPVLGQGGFGITYVGYDLNMEAKIAIKEYFPVELVSRDTTTMHGDRVLSLSGEKSATYKQGLKKYVAEAQNVSQFSEIPGVVSVKDFFYANETAYIVMEYIDGISLKDYLKEKGGRLTEEETLTIMKPVLEALVQVHKSGIIHRDISPDNIMLTFEGSGHSKIKSVKLIDFGAARMTTKNDQKSLTIILKHGYAPEEQYRTHGEQGPWTDVYALCAVLYRMLTGETPVPAMDRMFQDELKTFDKFNAKVSANTSAAILKGLAVKKDDRIQSVKELIGVLYEGAHVSKAAKKKNGKSMYLSVAGGLAAVLTGVFVMLSGEKAAVPETVIAEKTEGMVTEAVISDQSESEAETSETIAADQVEMAVEEEVLGKIIVTPTPQTDYASGEDHVVLRNEDGTVRALGLNQYGQGEVTEWSSIAAVTAGEKFSAGLRVDGTVLVAGELEGKDEVERWVDILAISGSRNRLYGLTKEGKILASYVSKGSDAEFLEWENIKAIASYGGEVTALDESGHVYVTGQFHMSGRLPHDLEGWTDVEQIVRTTCALLGVKSDGRLRYELIYDEADIVAEDIEDAMDFSNLDTFENIRQVFANRWGIYAVDRDGNTHVGGYAVSRGETYTVDDEVASWKNLIGVTGVSGDDRIAGIQADGQIVTTIDNLGRHNMEEMTNLERIEITNRDKLSNGMGVLGYGKDGVVYSYGDAEFLRYLEIGDSSDQPKEIESIWTGKDGWRVNHVACVGSDGSLYIQEYMGIDIQSKENLRGSNIEHIAYDSSQDCLVAVNRNGQIELYALSDLPIIDPFKQTENWKNIDQATMLTDSNEFGTCIIGLHQDGTVSAVSEHGDVSVGFEDWKDVKEIESNQSALGAILRDGTVRFWNNAPEQNIGQYNTNGWGEIQQLALGMYHTVGLKEDGTVYAVGSNAAGQCQVDDWKDIVSIAAGDSCTIGVKADGSMVVAGEIGW